MLECQNSELKNEPKIGFKKSPWLISILLLYVVSLLLGGLYFDILQAFYFGIFVHAPFILLIVADLLIIEEPLCAEEMKQFLNYASWPIAFWIVVFVYFSGGGLSQYIPRPYSQWIFSTGVLVGALIIVYSVNNDSWVGFSRIGFGMKCKKKPAIYILVAIGSFLPFLVDGILVGSLPSEDWSLWLDLLVTTTLFPAVTEEIVFRGILQEGLKSKYENRATAIAISSLIFGIVHIFTNKAPSSDLILGFVLTFAIQFIAGIILGIVYESSGSLYAPIVIHYLYNAKVWIIDSAPQLESTLLFRQQMSIAITLIIIGLVYLWPRIRTIPEYIQRFYLIAWRLLKCIKKCVERELRINVT